MEGTHGVQEVDVGVDGGEVLDDGGVAVLAPSVQTRLKRLTQQNKIDKDKTK